jgi:hypothetical protein
MLDRLVQEFPMKEQYDEILGSQDTLEALIWLLVQNHAPSSTMESGGS